MFLVMQIIFPEHVSKSEDMPSKKLYEVNLSTNILLNIKLLSKGFPVANALAYLSGVSVTKEKRSFIILTPGLSKTVKKEKIHLDLDCLIYCNRTLLSSTILKLSRTTLKG